MHSRNSGLAVQALQLASVVPFAHADHNRGAVRVSAQMPPQIPLSPSNARSRSSCHGRRLRAYARTTHRSVGGHSGTEAR